MAASYKIEHGSIRFSGEKIEAFRNKYGESFEKFNGANQALVSDIITAISGRHNILISGNPAAAELAQDMIETFTPLLDEEAANEVLEIHKASDNNAQFSYLPPVRVPSDNIDISGLVGKVQPKLYGELSLAHKGTLILNNVENFRDTSLEMLKYPLNNHKITLGYGYSGEQEVRPLDFQTVFITQDLSSKDFEKKVSDKGFFETIEIRNDGKSPFASKPVSWTVQKIIDTVTKSFELENTQGKTNSSLSDEELSDYINDCGLNDNDYFLLNPYAENRTQHEFNNMLRVAKTIANMQGIEFMDAGHVQAASMLCPTNMELLQRDMDSKEVCISLQQLYEYYESKGETFDLFGYRNVEIGERLGRIQKSYQNYGEENEEVYYDLYNQKDELVCCDGEVAKLIKEKDGIVWLEMFGERDTEEPFFKMTKEDLEIASFTQMIEGPNNEKLFLTPLRYDFADDITAFRDFLNQNYPIKEFTSQDAAYILEVDANIYDKPDQLALHDGKLWCHVIYGDSDDPQKDCPSYFEVLGNSKSVINDILQRTIDLSEKENHWTEKFGHFIQETTITWDNVREKLSELGWSVHDFQIQNNKHVISLYRKNDEEHTVDMAIYCDPDNPESFAQAYKDAAEEYDADHEAEHELRSLQIDHADDFVSINDLYKEYAEEKETLLNEAERLSEFVQNFGKPNIDLSEEHTYKILDEFKGANVVFNVLKDDCTAEITLPGSQNKISFDIDLSEIDSFNDLDDHWEGFKYKDCEFDLNIYRDEEERLFAAVYPVIDGETDADTFISIDSSVTHSINNSIQKDSATEGKNSPEEMFSFEDMKMQFENLGYNIESIESHFIEMGKLKVNLSFSTTMGYDIPISFEYEAEHPITALESFIKATKEWDVDSHIVSTREWLEQQLLSPSNNSIRLELEEAKNTMTNDAIELQKFRDDYLNNKLPKQKVLATQKVLGMVEMELNEYSSDNVDLIENEENGKLDIMYHSDNNSFVIKETGINLESVNIKDLKSGLDEYDVGYNFNEENVSSDLSKNNSKPEYIPDIKDILNEFKKLGYLIKGTHAGRNLDTVYLNKTTENGFDFPIKITYNHSNPINLFNSFIKKAEKINVKTKLEKNRWYFEEKGLSISDKTVIQDYTNTREQIQKEIPVIQNIRNSYLEKGSNSLSKKTEQLEKDFWDKVKKLTPEYDNNPVLSFRSCFMEAKAKPFTNEGVIFLYNIQSEIKDVCSNNRDFNRYIVEKTGLELTKENLQSVAEKMIEQKDILYKGKDIFLPKELEASKTITEILKKQGSIDIFDPHINVSDGKKDYFKFSGCLKYLPKMQQLKIKQQHKKNPEINRSRSSAEPEYSR